MSTIQFWWLCCSL